MTEALKSIGSNLDLKEYWYPHFQNYQRSGLNKTGYVREHKLSKNRFMYWSRKFELAQSSSHQSTGNDFTAVKTKSEPNERLNSILCSIRLGDYQLLIHDMAALPSIIQLLR